MEDWIYCSGGHVRKDADQPEQSQDTLKAHHHEYRRGVTDAIIWLLRNHDEMKPEFLASQMARDLL